MFRKIRNIIAIWFFASDRDIPMTLVSNPGDEKLMPIIERLAEKVISRIEEGSFELRLSPERSIAAGRIHLLLDQRLKELLPGHHVRLRNWTGPNHSTIMKVDLSKLQPE